MKTVVIGLALALSPLKVAVHGDSNARGVDTVDGQSARAVAAGPLARYTALVVDPVTVSRVPRRRGSSRHG